ncbi:MAG: hypothetical protein PHO07_18350 [Pirellulales bacterium]|jgi:hypothetical protein|nr:hypothetical protein [Thermoguttaceae bacterium]MDD4789132.1 hypothetical protein [Pirellulales bacterium]MDI9445589.1 hypothetical protein [Planctomycetota bacterium]
MCSVGSIEQQGLRGCSADSADERFAGIGTRTCHGTIHYRYLSGYETDRALSYHNVPTQQAAYARTIYDGPTSSYGDCGCGCGCDEGIPSPRAWSSYGWSVAGSGQGAIRESWHADHTRDEDWTSWVGGAKLSGTAASSSYGDWSLT